MADVVVESCRGRRYLWAVSRSRAIASPIVCFGVPDKENHAGVIKLPMMEMQRRELKLVLSVNYETIPMPTTR